MINKIKKYVKKYAMGFTLVETLVAVVVLMTAIAGPLTIASKSLQATLVAKDQDTAFYLAQDAMEYIRFVRDTNKLSGGDWLTGAGATVPANAKDLTPCEGASGCYFDSLGNNPSVITACSGACGPIYYDPTNDYFTYNTTGTTQTIFTRTVQILTPVGGNGNEVEAIASTTVSWQDTAGLTRQVQVREDIFNWQ
ncbi:MAG: hypothetical protein KGH79_01385 [Patescibacteria group bacterium]|nr:hypothetical protein [Patescibacteria group bacterium]